MKKLLTVILAIVLAISVVGTVFSFVYSSKLKDNYNKLQTTISQTTDDDEKQTLQQNADTIKLRQRFLIFVGISLLFYIVSVTIVLVVNRVLLKRQKE
jgi:uncharacterized ion transporter superfamily protein YfcC